MLILWKGFILSHVLEASRFYRHSKSRDMMPKVPGLTRLIPRRQHNLDHMSCDFAPLVASGGAVEFGSSVVLASTWSPAFAFLASIGLSSSARIIKVPWPKVHFDRRLLGASVAEPFPSIVAEPGPGSKKFL